MYRQYAALFIVVGIDQTEVRNYIPSCMNVYSDYHRLELKSSSSFISLKQERYKNKCAVFDFGLEQ